MAAEIPRQPDFAVVSQSFHTAAVELAKCPNIIGLQENTEMIGLLRGLTTSIARVEERLGRLENRMERIEDRLGRVEQSLVDIFFFFYHTIYNVDFLSVKK
jgi:hypothetical protein